VLPTQSRVNVARMMFLRARASGRSRSWQSSSQMPYQSSSAVSDVSLPRFGLRIIRATQPSAARSKTADCVAKGPRRSRRSRLPEASCATKRSDNEMDRLRRRLAAREATSCPVDTAWLTAVGALERSARLPRLRPDAAAREIKSSGDARDS
jgi:hypothetical protein